VHPPSVPGATTASSVAKDPLPSHNSTTSLQLDLTVRCRVTSLAVTTPLRPEAWHRHLRHHPDPNWSHRLVHDIIFGVNIGYTGKRSVFDYPFFSEFLLIHSFSDGNGRVARLLTNHILRGTVFVPFSIFYTSRELYLRVLEDRNDQSQPPLSLAYYMLLCARKTHEGVFNLVSAADDKE
jgi:hypothetical protein